MTKIIMQNILKKEHYRTIFNWNLPVDPSVLDDLLQSPTNANIGKKPSIQEVRIAIQKMKNTKPLDDLS